MYQISDRDMELVVRALKLIGCKELSRKDRENLRMASRCVSKFEKKMRVKDKELEKSKEATLWQDL